MNEFARLISSLVLLGAGFLAASVVGPPDALEHLSGYFRGAPAEPHGLQPLPADAPSLDTQGWPALPSRGAESPQSDALSAWVAPSVERASWPAPDDAPSESATAAKWDAPKAAPELRAPQRALKPIPRSTSRSAVAGATPPVRSAWDDAAGLAPAEPNRSQPGPALSLGDSPYGKRPGYETAANPADRGDAFPPLANSSPLAPSVLADTPQPIERAPASSSYTQHVVSDGDTLGELAERYLGDAARAEEIYDLNRDRLTNPDLLPIGMVLRTPTVPAHRRAATPDAWGNEPSQPNSAFSTVSAGGRLDRSQPGRPLVPIGAIADPPLTAEQSRGPVDPRYGHEVMWHAGGW